MNLRIKLLVDYYLGGIAHALLKPVVILLGVLLKRDHSLVNQKEVAVIKFLGGGSLIIAYPSLLALKQKYPAMKLTMVTSPAVLQFAELTGLFDEIIVIRDNGLINLAVDSIRAIWRLWRMPTLVDLEIHSRLSSIFTLLTCANNRVGVYTDLSFWRRDLYTHLLFYNKFSPIHSMYDQVVRLFEVDAIDIAAAKSKFIGQIGVVELPKLAAGKRVVGIAPGCSDLGRERVLTVQQWFTILSRRFSGQGDLVFYFIGGPRDSQPSRELISLLQPLLPQAEFHDCCGKYSLRESVELIARLESLYCIDSSPIHFARLLGVKTISFWGPTAPEMRLRPDAQLQEEVHYVRLSCSPCIHVASDPPCYGNNLCMTAAMDPENYTGERNPIWLAKAKADPQ